MVSTHLPLDQSLLASPLCGVGLGFGRRGEGVSPTDRKRDERGGHGGGERDTIWVPRTESQQSQTKIEGKGRRGGLWATSDVCRKVGRKRNRRAGNSKGWVRRRRRRRGGEGVWSGAHASEALRRPQPFKDQVMSSCQHLFYM